MRRGPAAALLVLLTAACGYDSPQAPTPPPPAQTPTPSPTPPTVTPSALSVSLVGGSGNTGRTVVFVASVAGTASPPFRFDVVFGDGTTTSRSSSDRSIDIEHVYGRAGIYATRLSVKDAADRVGENDGEVRITDRVEPPAPTPPAPPTPSYVVSVSASPQTVVAGEATTLTAIATPSNGAPPATAFDWDCLGDGTLDATGVGNVFTCIYASAGTKTASVTARSTTANATGSVTVTVTADAPLHVVITADDLTPAISQLVTFTATITSAGIIPATLRWYWDWANDGTYDHVEAGGNPNIQSHMYGVAEVTTIKVRVVDELTAREAISTLRFTVQ